MSIAIEPRTWGRYVAIGDSLSEGLADEQPGRPGVYRGWADLLAGLLAAHAEEQGRSFEYANLAIRGRKLDDITSRQTDAAIALEPDLVSLWGGGNDILRPRVDVDAISAMLEDAVVRLRGTGADVLLSTTTCPKGAPVIGWVTGRAAELTANIYTIAARHECYITDVWGIESLRDARMWAADRVHLTSEGHRRLAHRALGALGYPMDPRLDVPLPRCPATPRLEAAADTWRWARAYGAPWVQRRLTGRSSGEDVSPKRPQPTVWT